MLADTVELRLHLHGLVHTPTTFCATVSTTGRDEDRVYLVSLEGVRLDLDGDTVHATMPTDIAIRKGLL